MGHVPALERKPTAEITYAQDGTLTSEARELAGETLGSELIGSDLARLCKVLQTGCRIYG
jgi:hypothetical protein